jgi:hypothetical protein
MELFDQEDQQQEIKAEKKEEMQHAESVQHNLFDDEIIVQCAGKTLFGRDEIIDTAVRDFRERGFPYPNNTLAEMKMELNDLANCRPTCRAL